MSAMRSGSARIGIASLALLVSAHLASVPMAQAGAHGAGAARPLPGSKAQAPDAEMLLDLDFLKEPDFARQRELARRMRVIERIRLLENLRALEAEPESAPAKSGGTR